MLVTSSGSGRPERATILIARGTIKMPIATMPIRNPPSFPRVIARSPGDRFAPARDTGHHREQQDREQILDHHDREDQLGLGAGDPVLLEPLDHEHRARDPDADRDKHGLGVRPAEHAAGCECHDRDQTLFDDDGDERRQADTRDGPDAELEPDREEQEDHAELGQRLDEVNVGDRRRDVRPDQQPGEDVAEHDRQVQALEYEHGSRGGADDERELGEDGELCRHAGALAARPARTCSDCCTRLAASHTWGASRAHPVGIDPESTRAPPSDALVSRPYAVARCAPPARCPR